MHSDFRMVERDADHATDAATDMRNALRQAWTLPKDTFVTADFPLLLTRLDLLGGVAPTGGPDEADDDRA